MYEKFKKLLKKYEKDKWIKILHRGVSKEFAFKRLNLDEKHNTLKQFSDKIYFYGEKSKYFWSEFMDNIGINDISFDAFNTIFNLFNKLDKSIIPFEFYHKNVKEFNYFKKENNRKLFLKLIETLDEFKRKETRNYYFIILHQLDDNNYKSKSMFVSSTKDSQVAKDFSKNEIVINFWSLNESNLSFSKLNLPLFKGEAYPNEKETSIYGVIFPQYIYSFTYRGKTYPNPSINSEKNLELAILSGLEIQQKDFKNKMKLETAYNMGLKSDGIKDIEIR